MNKNEIRQKAFNSRRTVNKEQQEYYTDYQPEYKRLGVNPLSVPINDKENLDIYIQKDLINKEKQIAEEEFNKVLKLFRSGEISEEQFKDNSDKINEIRNYKIRSIKMNYKSNPDLGNYEESSNIPPKPIQQRIKASKEDVNKYSELIKKIPQGNYQLPHVSDNVGDNHLWSRVKSDKDVDILENKVFDDAINYDDVNSKPGEDETKISSLNLSAINIGEYSLLYDGDIVFTGNKDEVKSLIEDLVRENNGVEENRIMVFKRIDVSFGCSLNG